ncbi:MAG: acyl-CoA thioesterase [bacterium]|jgi:acyl-CoA thioester hydrolase
MRDARNDARSDYPHWREIPTRWMDNDVYGHVNNVVYYSYFDTLVNANLIEQAGVDIRHLDTIGVVVETGCRFYEELSFPDVVEAGLRTVKIGRTSVVYEIILFRKGRATPAASGRFVHVYVDQEHRRPADIPPQIREILQALYVEVPEAV